MAGLLLIAGLAWADDTAACDPTTALDQAREAVLALDLEGGHAQLDEAEDTFGCGVATPAQIAKFWIITGALASFEGDEADRDAALLAARVADESLWLDAFGQDLREIWSTSVPLEGEATLRLSDLPEGYAVRIDGKEAKGDLLTFSPGLHVLQVSGGEHFFGRVVRGRPGDSITMPTGLPELPKSAVVPDPVPDAEPEPKPDKPEKPIKPPKPDRPAGDGLPVALHVGVGFGALVGPGFEIAEVTEPAAKLGPLVEVGAVLRPVEMAWVRAALGADIALAGRYAYLGGDESAHSLPLAPVLHVSGGVTLAERIDVGGLVGLQLPSRVPLRVVGSYGINDLIRVEARAGLNLIGEKTVLDGETTGSIVAEPAFAALAAFSF
ncbi:MAG: hypothetical protein R3F61_22520 [Myxococcota bacterium]